MLLKLTFIANLLLNLAGQANLNISLSEIGLTEQEQMYENHVREVYEDAGLDTMDLDFGTFHEALTGYYNFQKSDTTLSDKQLLTIIDFTKPITEKRMYTIDLGKREVLYHTLTAHGMKSGTTYADQYSNVDDSNMSSEGFMITGDTYYGIRGYSLYLHGMDEGINDNVYLRNVVMHPATAIAKKGKETLAIGRSLGCPSIDPVYAKDVINLIKEGTLIYIKGKDTEFAEQTTYLNPISAFVGFMKNVA